MPKNLPKTTKNFKYIV